MCTRLCVYIYKYMYVCMDVRNAYSCVPTYVYIYVHMYICSHICTYLFNRVVMMVVDDSHASPAEILLRGGARALVIRTGEGRRPASGSSGSATPTSVSSWLPRRDFHEWV